MKAESPESVVFRYLPALRGRVPWVPLGIYPTAIDVLEGLEGARGLVGVKREDVSAEGYGGNKIRTLEFLLAEARDAGRRRIWSVGCYGSNHALAAALHAPRVGLQAGAFLVPQPCSVTAAENLARTLSTGAALQVARSTLDVPRAFAGLLAAKIRKPGEETVMPPGGATPTGALGHVGAALEVAEQIRAGVFPEPADIVLPYGSGCTAAGLVVGVALARQLRVGFERLPRIHAVRIGPWPATSRWMLGRLVTRTVARLRSWGGPDLARETARVWEAARVDGRYVGGGYGHPTSAGLAAAEAFRRAGGPPLDTTYSAKAAAALLTGARGGSGPWLFWSTKSSRPLPPTDAARIARAPAALQRYLGSVSSTNRR